MKTNEAVIKEDVLIPTQCGRCYAACAVKVRRVNGVAVKIEGFPESNTGCPRGALQQGTRRSSGTLRPQPAE